MLEEELGCVVGVPKPWTYHMRIKWRQSAPKLLCTIHGWASLDYSLLLPHQGHDLIYGVATIYPRDRGACIPAVASGSGKDRPPGWQGVRRCLVNDSLDGHGGGLVYG